MAQAQCPNCKSYRTVSASMIMVASGFTCLVVGLVIWPLLPIAAVFFALGFFAKIGARGKGANGMNFCRACNFKW